MSEAPCKLLKLENWAAFLSKQNEVAVENIAPFTVFLSLHFEERQQGFVLWGFLKGPNSLAHKLNFVGHVIVTAALQRMHFPRPGFFLRWDSNLQQVDFGQGFASNNILELVVLAVNDGFLHLHAFVISPFFCLHFCHLEIQI